MSYLNNNKYLKQLIEDQAKKNPDKNWDIRDIEEISNKYLHEFAGHLYQKYKVILQEGQDKFWDSQSDYSAGKCDGYADIIAGLTRDLTEFEETK